MLADPSLSREEVARKTGRSLKAVYNQASRCGEARSVLDSCSADELKALYDHDLTFADIARLTGLSCNEIEYRRRLLGVPRRKEWTDAELALVDDVSLPYAEVAQRTGRSRTAVKVLAQRRGAHRHTFWSVPSYVPRTPGYRGEDWPEVRQAVWERDGYTCQDGGEFVPSGRGLVAHHMIPWRLRPVNDLQWLVTLCRPCHGKRPEHHWAEIPEAIASLLGEGR